MTIFRVLVIFALVAGILGASIYYSYELFWKPNLPPAEDVATPPPPPPPRPDVLAFEKAKALRGGDDREAERKALLVFLANYPDSAKASEAEEILGKLNAARLFGPEENELKVPYTVVKGDSLVRIASKQDSNAEMIYRVNNLETINLQIGQKLNIPKLDISMTIDSKGGSLTIFNGGEFFRKYQILSMPKSATGSTSVLDKLVLNGSERVAFGSKDYPGSDRWIMLGQSGLVIRAMPEDTSGRPPAGILVSPDEIEEIFLLVSRGVPVTIK